LKIEGAGQGSEKTLGSSGWLGENPIYYNLSSSHYGNSIWDAIGRNDLKIDLDGLADYFKFGYSVFGSTPVSGVNFLRPNENLILKDDGTLGVVRTLDPVDTWVGVETSIKDAVDQFFDWEFRCDENDEVILPLSSGLDSRMLLLYLKNKNLKFSTYSYGTSRLQHDSSELIVARDIARRADAPWRQIVLNNYHAEIGTWFKRYGPAMHLHGMYQIEFYKKILGLHGRSHVLSGIVGDLWAGSQSLATPKSPRDLENYGLSRGLNIPHEALVHHGHRGNSEAEFEQVREQLSEPLHQITYLIRTKMLLLSYLVDVPRMLGAEVSSPFLDEKVAMSFSTISQKYRENRNWQFEYLKKSGFEAVPGESGNRDYTMDYGELDLHPLKPLDVVPLSRFLRAEYIEWVNKKVKTITVRDRLWLKMRETHRVFPSIGNQLRSNTTMDAYAAYMCMKPIELLLSIAEAK
jgi:asparagine synthetase B (glutamine-hydrolysing)